MNDKTEFGLVQVTVAGVAHHNTFDDLRGLGIGSTLTLTREPENPHDRNAVLVGWSGRKLGYIPRNIAPLVARVMDAGYPLHGVTCLGSDGFSIIILVVMARAV